MACATCGAREPSRAACAEGHFVCDRCHGASAREVIERVCAATPLRDPVEIAVGLMRHPSVKLHGPEHHVLVPAALAAAWANLRGEPPARRAELVAEARRRAEPIPGGACGYQGACGAALGAGIFVSLATGATPLSSGAWRLANRASARALAVVAEAGGPRCCKRDVLLSLLAAVRFGKEHLGVDWRASGVACEWSAENAECLRAECPFYREPRPGNAS